MDDDDKADLARRGIDLIDDVGELSPEALKQRVANAAKGTAQKVALGGVRAISSLVGGSPKRARIGPSAAVVERTLERLEQESVAQFDDELRRAAQRAAARKAQEAQRKAEEVDVDAAEAEAFAALRRSFPPESKELAILLFSCVDLLEDVVEIDDPPNPSELAKREILIARIAELLAPRAAPALESFVAHVVSLSQQRRARGG